MDFIGNENTYYFILLVMQMDIRDETGVEQRASSSISRGWSLEVCPFLNHGGGPLLKGAFGRNGSCLDVGHFWRLFASSRPFREISNRQNTEHTK